MHPLLQDATEEQRLAISHRDGPAFVSAAPGSGKSRVITYRIAYLIDQGVHPRNIIGITFTNKAANVMKERIRKLVDPGLASKVWLSTFHSLCVRVMRANPQFYGVHKKFGIADENDSKQLVTLAIAKVSGKTEKEVKKLAGTGDVGHVRRWISAQKDLVLTPGAVQEKVSEGEPVKFHQFVPFYKEYQRLLRKNNLLDFDDLIMRVVLKIRASEEQQQFFAEHLHYLLVDEYQDTNYAQFELVRLISHVRGNVLVCGDLEQLVYGWRGADIKNAQRFYKCFPDTKTFMLQTNFRSVPGIANVANRVIQNNERLHAKEIVTHKIEGKTPHLVELENTDREAEWIVNTIRDLVRGGEYTWKDFAVIYRIRSLSRSLEDEAVSKHIPYRVIGSINFYSRTHIKDILSYCRLVVYPHDDSAFTRIYNKPARGVGPANFARFAATADKERFSLVKTLMKGLYRDTAKAGAVSGFRSLKKMFSELRTMHTSGASSTADIIEYIILHSGYKYFAESIKDEDRSARMLEDLQELVEAAKTFDVTDKRKKSGIDGFLEHAALMQRNDKEKEDNSVTFMTAHAAKGLEFPCVFVRSVVEGILPLHPRSDDGQDMMDSTLRKLHYEEERRVFYVAVTRAEDRLFVSYPKIRRFRDGIQNCSPSRFCREAGDSLEFVSMVDENKALYAGGGRRNKPYSGKPTRANIQDGGAQDIILLRERKRRGTATKADLEVLEAEEIRLRRVLMPKNKYDELS